MLEVPLYAKKHADEKAKKAFTTHKDKYGTLTADGTLLLTENTFKLTIATKS